MGVKKRVLYISYDDVAEPLSESQVLPYLNGLSGRHDIYLMTFNKKRISPRVVEGIAANNGLSALYCLSYHKRPLLPATLWDIARGVMKSLSVLKKERIDFIHARSYVACAIAFLLKKIRNIPYIFDIRGLLADERADSGDWDKNSIAYRAVKLCEKAFLREASVVISLTGTGAMILRDAFSIPDSRIKVIPTCVDTSLFRPETDRAPSGKPLKFIYIGSLGTWYMLKEMLDFFKVAVTARPGSELLILTHSGQERARKFLKEMGLPGGCVEIANSSHEDVPRHLTRRDASIFFIRPTFSKKFSCPTKFAESLSAGLPVITNSGIGDLDHFIKKYSTGVIIENFSAHDYENALNSLGEMLADRRALSERCRDLSLKEFSLESGIDKYALAYEAVT